LEFSARHGSGLRYVAAWGKWFRWTGQRWQEDSTLLAFDHARQVCRSVAVSLPETHAKLGKGLTRANTVAAVERLAKADRRHAETVDVWDRDLHLINTPDGVVNLITGQLLPHCSEHMMTKMTAVGPDATWPCPIWQAFLNRIMQGDQELICFLQRLFGYALTGFTKEHVLAFCYGTGANGKGTLLNSVTGIMGDYFRAAPIETFTATNFDRHPAELAMLRGARLVAATEPSRGGAGPRRASRSSPEATRSPPALCAKISSTTFRNSPWSSPVTTNQGCAPLTRRSAGGSS
jgi:phage/plasmid-associated DNA primase